MSTAPPPTTPIITRPGQIKHSFNPVRYFADSAFAARAWFWLFLLALGFALVEPYFLISALKQQEYVTIIDESGTFHRAPLLGYESADQLYQYIAKLAALSMFQKNPKGLDYPELAALVFRQQALANLEALVKSQKGEFDSKQLYQKVSILKYKTFHSDENTAIIGIEGQLIQTGVVDGARFVPDPINFQCVYTLIRNPDMTHNGRFPMAVQSYTLKAVTP